MRCGATHTEQRPQFAGSALTTQRFLHRCTDSLTSVIAVVNQSNLTRYLGAVGGTFLVAITLLLALSASASAAPSQLVIDTRAPELQKGDDGTPNFELSFANLTSEPIVLSAIALHQRRCKPTLSTNQLPSAQVTPVTVELPPKCKTGEGLAVDIAARSSVGPLSSFEIHPEEEVTEAPDWDQLWAFPIALVVSLVGALVMFFCGWRLGKGAKRRWREPLRSLDVSTWKFNDNWATNVSAVGAVLTGVFSATTAKAFLGEDAESAVALATVGAAIALSFVAAGPVILVAFKKFKIVKKEDGKAVSVKRKDAFTVDGLLLGAAVVLASGYGQLWVVMETGMELDLGGLEDWLWIPALVGVALLSVYSWRSVKDLLERGTEESEKPDEVEIKAAQKIADAIEGKKKTEGAGVDAGEVPHRQRPRSALL